MKPQQKITFREMRASGVRGLLIYWSDYRCSHSTAISGDRWPDHVRLSDLEDRFTCQACGQKGADLRPNFNWEKEARHTYRDTFGHDWTTEYQFTEGGEYPFRPADPAAQRGLRTSSFDGCRAD